MADQEYVISLKIDGAGAVTNLQEVQDTVAKSNNNLIQLRKELKSVQNDLLGLEPGTKEFNKLAARAGELKDRMNDVSDAVRSNAGPAFENLGSQAGMLKDRLFNLDFKGVGESFRSLGSTLKGVSFKDVSDGLKGLTTGFVQFGKALLANPIFLLGAVVIGIIANMDKLLDLIDGVSSADEKNLEILKQKSAVSKEQLDTVSAQENILKQQGKTEKEILQIKIKASEVAIADLEAQLLAQQEIKNQQIESAKRNHEILAGVLTFITAPLRLLAQSIDAVGTALGQNFGLVEKLGAGVTSLTNLLFDPAEVATEADASIKETQKALDALKNQRAGYELSVVAINKKSADERLANEQKLKEELLKSDAESIAAREQLLKEADERKLAQYIEAAEEQAELLLNFEIKNSDNRLQVLAREQKQKQVFEEEEKQRQYALSQTRLQLAGSVINSISAINDAFANKSAKNAERQFKINKALSIASAIVSGAQAVVTQLGTNPGPYAFVAAGLAAVAAAANIIKISRTKFNAGGGDTGGGGGGSGVPGLSGGNGGAEPNVGFNPLNTQFIQNRPDQQTVPAYVLAGDVVDNVEARQKVEDRARL